MLQQVTVILRLARSCIRTPVDHDIGRPTPQSVADVHLAARANVQRNAEQLRAQRAMDDKGRSTGKTGFGILAMTAKVIRDESN